MNYIIKGIFLLLISLEVQAGEMNGIIFKQYARFEQKWKLVTVRYRKDNNEMRFVYANPIAWKAIQKGRSEYPDGSILAKVAYLSRPDPAFESSLGPGESRRIQFMVKNKKRYREYHGWGYALFNSYGEINPEPVNDQINACSSCHAVIPERDFVFSWPINNKPKSQINLFKLNHKEVALTDLLPEQVAVIPKNFQKVLKIESTLTKKVFQGTLDELQPALARHSVQNRLPVVFISDDKKKYTIIYPEDLSIECNDEGVKGLFVVSITSMPGNILNRNHFCQSFH
jgi:hypothetical protein